MYTDLGSRLYTDVKKILDSNSLIQGIIQWVKSMGKTDSKESNSPNHYPTVTQSLPNHHYPIIIFFVLVVFFLKDKKKYDHLKSMAHCCTVLLIEL